MRGIGDTHSQAVGIIASASGAAAASGSDATVPRMLAEHGLIVVEALT